MTVAIQHSDSSPPSQSEESTNHSVNIESRNTESGSRKQIWVKYQGRSTEPKHSLALVEKQNEQQKRKDGSRVKYKICQQVWAFNNGLSNIWRYFKYKSGTKICVNYDDAHLVKHPKGNLD